MLWVLLACTVSPNSIEREDTPSCDPREISKQEIRLRPLMCGDDDITGGGIRRGDWLLENNNIRVGLREVGSSLSTLKGSGGSIVDIALTGRQDSVLEILPYQNGILEIEKWEIIEMENMISIQFLPLDIGISLQTNQSELKFWGNTEWLLRPKEGTKRIGKELILPNQDLVLYIDGNIEDLGGDFLFSELNAIDIGSPANIFGEKEASQWIEIHSSGDELILFQEETTLGFIPIEDGYAQGYIPAETTHLQAQKEGCISSSLMDISATQISVGDCGSLLIRLLENEQERNGLMWANEKYHFIAKQGQRIPFSQTLQNIRIDAGFEFEPIAIRSLDPFEHPTLELYLQRALPEIYSLSLNNLVSPDFEVRESREDILLQNIGLHIDYALLSARNVVPSTQNPLPAQLQDQIFLETGLISEHEKGSFLSFPWSPSQQPAFGAIRVDSLNFEAAIAMAAQKDRFLVLNYSAISEISHETFWEAPHFLRITSAEEALDFAQNCGGHLYSKPISDHVWLPHLRQAHSSKKEIEHELHSGSLGLGNGPLLTVTALSLGERTDLMQVYLHGNSENQPEKLALYSEEGEEKIWEIAEFPFEEIIILPPRNVFCFVAFSEEIESSWALSTPFYARDP